MIIAYVIFIAVLLGLAYLLYREIRRSPGPMKWGRRPRWKKRLRIAFVAAILLITFAAFWGFLVEPNRLVVRHETVAIDNWPKELDGLKIAVLSDIHVGSNFINDRKLRLIVERTNQLQPEVIVILGDYMTGARVKPEVFGAVLKELKAPLGVYSVLGNHDWWWDGQRVRRGLEANGIKVLENEVLEVRRGSSSVWLAGLADLWTRNQYIEETIEKVPVGQPVIALTHNPDIFPTVPERVALMLAGHTHGGQVRFPIVGTLIEPSRYGDRYVRGHTFENNRHLFVTTGIGTSIIPVRFGVPPEIVLLTVRSGEAALHKSDFNGSTIGEPKGRSGRKAEPGAKRSGATGSH